jgi:LuxR family maltose regulon positive regulatory protein
LLRQRLQQTQPGAVPELHRRASVWYERNGLVVEAVEHALKAGDLGRVEQLVAERILTMIYHGEFTTLMGWLEALPHKVVRSRPWLCVAYAWVLAYAGQPGSIEPLLEDAEDALADVYGAAERRHVAGHIAAICAYLSIMKRKVSRAAALAREALEYFPEEDLMVRSFTTGVAAIALRMSGDLVAAAQATTEAIALAQAADADYIAVDVRCDLARLQMARGQLRKRLPPAKMLCNLSKVPLGGEDCRCRSWDTCLPTSVWCCASGTIWRPRCTTPGIASNCAGAGVRKTT